MTKTFFSAAFNIGMTEARLRDLIVGLEAKVGKQEAANAAEVLKKRSRYPFATA